MRGARAISNFHFLCLPLQNPTFVINCPAFVSSRSRQSVSLQHAATNNPNGNGISLFSLSINGPCAIQTLRHARNRRHSSHSSHSGGLDIRLRSCSPFATAGTMARKATGPFRRHGYRWKIPGDLSPVDRSKLGRQRLQHKEPSGRRLFQGLSLSKLLVPLSSQ